MQDDRTNLIHSYATGGGGGGRLLKQFKSGLDEFSNQQFKEAVTEVVISVQFDSPPQFLVPKETLALRAPFRWRKSSLQCQCVPL